MQTVLFGVFVMYVACVAQLFVIGGKGDDLWGESLVWVAAILNSRGVAKLILRRWRDMRNYGYWLIGIATALAIVVLIPWSRVVDWKNVLIAAAVTTLAQFICVPWLIEKRPTVPLPNCYPVLLWLTIGLIPLCARLKI